MSSLHGIIFGISICIFAIAQLLLFRETFRLPSANTARGQRAQVLEWAWVAGPVVILILLGVAGYQEI